LTRWKHAGRVYGAISTFGLVKMNESKRRENERKFSTWEELPGGGRRYFYEVQGRDGWKARYVKEVDASETTEILPGNL